MNNRLCRIMLTLLCSFIWIPIGILAVSSFMGQQEITERFGGIFFAAAEPVSVTWIPSYPTFQPFAELLLDSPEFFIMFWNTVGQVLLILSGQLLVAVPCAWSFAVYQFRGKKWLFWLYLIVMILPFQVTMVSSYLILDLLHLMNHPLAIILPGIFSPFPVFVMVKAFAGIPLPLLEAARIDGAGEWNMFRYIGLPLGKTGIYAALLLGFFEYWNALEQPLTFLKDRSLWPLSLYLPNITPDQAALSFAAAMIMMLPCVLLSILGEEYLKEGILSSGIKE